MKSNIIDKACIFHMFIYVWKCIFNITCRGSGASEAVNEVVSEPEGIVKIDFGL